VGGNAYFEMPSTIKRLESFAHRGAARVDKVIPIDWRYAPDGEGYGDFASGSMSDLSRGGASLVVGRAIKPGTSLEVRFALDPKGAKLVEICQVMRASKIGTSANFTAGIRFLAMSSANETALMKFLQELQATRRDRGIV
jgi:c-di-GMP-binding flagellar brake protein YcgR